MCASRIRLIDVFSDLVVDIEIDTYKPEYLEQQVALGEEIRSSWPLGGQTPLERLQERYDSTDFDPETKFYALQDGSVVGFVTTSISGNRAKLDFPIVRDNDGKIGKMLLDHVLEQLKQRGVTEVNARASSVWGKTEVYAMGYGFDISEVQLAQGSRMNRVLPDIDDDATTPINLTDDEDLMRSIFANQLGYTEDYIDTQLDQLKADNIVLDWRVLRRGDDIIAHGVVVNEPVESDRAYLVHLYLHPDVPDQSEEFVKSILADLDQDNLEYIDVILAREQTQFIDLFQSLGFTFTKIMLYRKQLE